MKILHINTFDIQGGAARAAYRLHKSLQSIGLESKMLVRTKKSDDFTVIGPENKIQKINFILRQRFDRFPSYFYKQKKNTIYSPSCVPCSGIIDSIDSYEPDIVHLHWICDGFLRIEDIAKIRTPIIWTLHDDWAFTGGCHLREECDKYTQQCGACPILGSNRENDLSRKIWKRKHKTYSKIPQLTVIGLSRWIAACAKKSSLFKHRNVVNLPNPINTDVFKPIQKSMAKLLLDSSQDKKLIAFSGIGAASNTNKGFEELRKALSYVDDYETELIVFGTNPLANPHAPVLKTHYIGNLHDDLSLRILYSAADVVVVPSLRETLSNTIMEALACGTPVVAFNVSGNPDLINHKINGYLAEPFDFRDLASGIAWVLIHSDLEGFSILAREKVMKEFNYRIVSEMYLKIYQKALRAKNR